MKEKKWVHPTEEVIRREVTFADDTDDAIAEICLVDEDKDGSVIVLDGNKKVIKAFICTYVSPII